MKKFLQINRSIIFAVILLLLVLSNCNKPDDTTNDEPTPPTVNTDTASFVSQTWATLNGIIKAGSLLTTISFEYDTDTNQVVFRYTITANPDTLSGNTSTRRTANLTGLLPNTTYYFRPKAVNSLGETYGTRYGFTTLEIESSDIVFNPDLSYEEISDIEGNVYKTIKIGDHIWMAQNLSVTKYNDGEQIPLVIDKSDWANLSTAAYSWYDNIEVKYGVLYNWYAVNSGKICPVGWRVSTDEDWTTLVNYLGGEAVAGSNLKETGIVHWTIPNTGATNSSGFTALPGGYKYYGDYYNAITYDAIQKYGYWWTSTSETSNSGVGHRLYYGYANIDKINIDKRVGASVRCVKE